MTSRYGRLRLRGLDSQSGTSLARELHEGPSVLPANSERAVRLAELGERMQVGGKPG